MKFYNTATRKVEEFKPLGDIVKIYTCGPTVYNYAHIGNFASYIYWDLLVRALKANGYNVKRVLNLTDVGHLVSDGDEGEDKLEKGARREGKSAFEVAKMYIDAYMKDFHLLNLTEPDVLARATDYVKDDMEAVDEMTKNGFTYETRDGIYYDTSKFPGYADFARLDLEGLKAGARVDFSDEKHNAADFAVWKFIQPGEKHEMRWDYLGRPGYPGWHLECSTIIHKELGEPIDIHTGGIDHIPVHHTNEIAQTYALNGKPLAKYWLHCDFILIDGQRVSKSLGNTYTLDDLATRGFSPMDYKMWILQGHFQGSRNFTFESLEAAKSRRLNWRNRIALCYQKEIISTGAFDQILDAVNNNLNSAEAFAIIDNSELSIDDWKKIDDLFGLNLINDTPDVDKEVYELIEERAYARAVKDYATSDEIRDKLVAKGIAIRDTAEKAFWEYI